MDRFSKFHPVVGFSFFIFIIILTVCIKNPVYLISSFLLSFIYNLKIAGKSTFTNLKYLALLVLFAGVFNFIFCHYGSMVVFTAFDYDFTFECFFYGILNGVMLSAVILWFSSYSRVITSEKFMALFGNFAPNLTLLFSMVLRFIPLMVKTSEDIKDSALGMGKEIKGVKNAITRFSALVSISLEKSIETADAMKSRGFGEKKRTSYNRFSFNYKDGLLLALLICLFSLIIISQIIKINGFSCENGLVFSKINYVFYILFFVMCAVPVIIDAVEDLKWLYLKSKI